MRQDLEKQAQRLHLFIHQLQSSVVRACESGPLMPYESIVETHAGLLRDELKKIEEAGGDPYVALMTVFLMQEVRV